MSEVYRGVACVECGRLRGKPAACAGCGARSHVDPEQGACPTCLAAAQPRLGARILGLLGGIEGWVIRHPLWALVLGVYLVSGLSSGSGALFARFMKARLNADPTHQALTRGAVVSAYLEGATSRAPEPVAPYTEREAPLLASPRLLARPGSAARDPRALIDRAERLMDTGVPLTVVRTTLATGAAELAIAARPRRSQIAPVHFNGEVAGIRLQGFSPESLPSMAGLRNGDIVTAINGVPITTPERAFEAYEASRAAGAAVMEVIRGAQRVILVVNLPSTR